MPIQTDTNKQYNQYVYKWQLMRVVIEGDDDYYSYDGTGQSGYSSIYGKRLTDYLPATFRTSDAERFQVYADRAVFANYTENTMVGMRGMIQRLEAPAYDLPVQTEYLKDDWDGNGQDSDQLIKEVVTELLSVGRIGILVDYPEAVEGLSSEEVTALELRANFAIYKAEDILDWDTDTRNGYTILRAIKLREIMEKRTGILDREEEEHYRVLALDEDEKYFWQLFDQDNNPISEQVYPRTATGEQWKLIPFFFGGSENNKSDVDKPPLYSIAKLNLAHYRNSADYEENLFIHGQGTFILDTGMVTNSEMETNFSSGLLVGAREAIAGPGFKGEMLQIEASGALPTAMDGKVEQMVQIGADIIAEKGFNETAKAATIDASKKTSRLGVIVRNTEHLINNAHMAACMFMGCDPESVDIKLNMDFFDASMAPQDVMAGIALVGAGHIALADWRMKLRKTDWLDPKRTDEEIDSEAEVAGIV